MTRIIAECHSDDRCIEIEFDATHFFEVCTEAEVLTLANCDWGGDYPADAVADHFCDSSTERLFSYLAAKLGGEPCGYECHVDEQSAMAWLRQHRPDVAAKLEREETI